MIANETKKDYLFLFKWAFIAMIMGPASGVVSYLFITYYLKCAAFIEQNFNNLIFLLPLLGGVIVSLLYLIEPLARGEGFPDCIVGIDQRGGYLKLKATLLKYFAAFFTLVLYGSGGIIGPLSRVCAGIGSSIGGILKRFQFFAEERTTFCICGVSGAVGAILQSPIGGGIFAVEILKRAPLRYSQLFPSILASTAGFLVVQFLPNYKGLFHIKNVQAVAAFSYLPWLAVLGLLCGFIGLFFIISFEQIYRLFLSLKLSLTKRVLLGGVLISTIGFLIGKDVIGIGPHLFGQIMEGKLAPFLIFDKLYLILLALILAKMLSISITVSSGFSAGLTGPSLLLGAAIGAALASFLGLHAGGPLYLTFVACGMAGFLSSSINVPIAGIVIVIEAFGIKHGIYAGLVSIIAFQVARSKTIYQLAIDTLRTRGFSDKPAIAGLAPEGTAQP